MPWLPEGSVSAVIRLHHHMGADMIAVCYYRSIRSAQGIDEDVTRWVQFSRMRALDAKQHCPVPRGLGLQTRFSN